MPIHRDIVTPERLVYSDEVDEVVAPGSQGELGILPHHAPLLTTLGLGELRIRKGGSEESFAIIGGVLPGAAGAAPGSGPSRPTGPGRSPSSGPRRRVARPRGRSRPASSSRPT